MFIWEGLDWIGYPINSQGEILPFLERSYDTHTTNISSVQKAGEANCSILVWRAQMMLGLMRCGHL